MTVRIRTAHQSDRDDVLDFCKNTFIWGDYIDQAWDEWISDKSGRLYVSLDDNQMAIGLAHVALCPLNSSIWLEGVRVRTDQRRQGIASTLIQTMLDFGKEKGASEALGIVAAGNSASRQMMEKSGFVAISDWVCFNTERNMAPVKSSSRMATIADVSEIQRYLDHSEGYKQSAGRYVDSWRWYRIDRQALRTFVGRKRVIVNGDPVSGIALVNMEGYWNRRDVIQIVYLDASSSDSLVSIVNFVSALYVKGGFRRLQILCHRSLAPALSQFNLNDSEQFLLYQKLLANA